MAKKAKTNARKKRQAEKIAEQQSEGVTRRGILRVAGFGTVGLLAAGGVAYAGMGLYDRHLREHDLGIIGQGVPVVVQVHDPQCPMCTALQRETRKALKQFDDEDLRYVIADITQIEGQVFSQRHNVPHVTLVLFDGKGEVTQVLSGVRQKAELVSAFERLTDRFSS